MVFSERPGRGVRFAVFVKAEHTTGVGIKYGDAVDLLADLRSVDSTGGARFPVLKGPKVGPMWVRIMAAGGACRPGAGAPLERHAAVAVPRVGRRRHELAVGLAVAVAGSSRWRTGRRKAASAAMALGRS